MNILVIGGGGREHALVWKLAQSRHRPRIFCAPGNAGTDGLAVSVPVKAEDVDGLLAWAQKEKPDLTVVGSEVPLCAGVADRFQAAGFRIFGPSQAAAALEGSKIFSKDVMVAGGVPTARAERFDDFQKAAAYAGSRPLPLVIKAEGLAAGKGVSICTTPAEAEQALREALVDKIFGAAGGRVLVEDFLAGEEASVLALVDGEHIALLASAQDHKRVRDHDEGPNTGGMGAYSPAPVITDDLWPVIRREVFERTLAELRRRGIRYQGVLYAGLMLTARGMFVLEFNCRFGDPETQVILPRLDADLVDLMQACIDGNLSESMLKWKPEACVCVVMASGGYPGAYAKGRPIRGLEQAGRRPGVVVFHAGTRRAGPAAVTDGGRVLGVTALGKDLQAAVASAYNAAQDIQFEGAHYRRDIAGRALGKKS